MMSAATSTTLLKEFGHKSEADKKSVVMLIAGEPKSEVRCARLTYGYNAQRILYWFTIKRTNQYWEEVKKSGDGLRIIHYSSSPKPWATMGKPGGDLELLWQ